ncbi:imidazole glycerol phosphate synthase subunit HisH [Candidatus Pelagibacter sp.]|uniref:imidazole glycerol phosphate synthase subunit HisH n=1 Tax=Candidatus Pelagibacter sp. TaxID=2024849 RepID=UPI003F865C34
MFKVCILDYGLGNIQSLKNALNKIGIQSDFYSEKKKVNYDLIFIPGIGSYFKASKLIFKKEYINFLNIKNKNAKIFGICLGMQIFSTLGDEFGVSKGLNYIPGKTVKIKNPKNKLILPFVGYFNVKFNNLKEFHFLKEFNNKKFYFVHSYEIKPKFKSHILSVTNNQSTLYCSAVANERYFGTQFHPEKSGDLGLDFLKKVILNII